MRLYSRRTIDEFAELHADCKNAMADWCTNVENAHWRDASHMVTSMPGARSIGGNRAVFNVKGNDYRIVCRIRYADASGEYNGIVGIEFVGTHAEYDDIDAHTVTFKAPRKTT